jgi:Ca2+-binding RTX toxin-like protein
MITNALSITAFGAKTSAADNTKAIQQTIDAARAQHKAVWVPAGEWKHAGILKLDGVKMAGEGDSSALIGTNRAAMALQLSGDGSGVTDLRLEGPDGARLSAYTACGISAIGANNFTIKNVTIDHSGAAGMHITGSSNGLIENNHLIYTGADSIHMSNNRGMNQNITVRNNDIEHPHDDGVAVVSYGPSRSGAPASHHILVENNSVTDQQWGRGYTVVGGHDVTIRGNYYDNNMSGGAGIYIASEGSYDTLGVSNVWVEGNLIKNAGGSKHASIQVYAGNKPVANIHIEDNAIYASKAASIVTNGSGGGRDIYISDNVSYGPAKNADDFVVQLNGTKTIESNNKILAKAAYPGDKAFDVDAGSGSAPVDPKPPVDHPIPDPMIPPPPVPEPAKPEVLKYEGGVWWKIGPTEKAVSGTPSSETIKGTDYSEIINGKGGNDTMVGLKGHDTYHIDSSGDKIVEQSGHGVDQAIVSINNFTLPANVENATVNYSGNATLTGNAIDNWMNGGRGNDIIDGAGGKDRLYGDSGNDTFVFHKGELNGDQILDFAGNGTKPGDVLKFEGFGKGATLTHNGDTWAVHHAGGTEIFKLIGVNELASDEAVFV